MQKYSPDPFAFETDASKGISLIYLEQIREVSVGSTGIINNDHFNALLRRVVAHEMGHDPQSHGDTAYHEEGGLMDPFNLEADGDDAVFAPKTIHRMRNANTWRQ